MDFDEVLKEVGSFGLYQKIIICAVLLPAALPCAFHAYRWVMNIQSQIEYDFIVREKCKRSCLVNCLLQPHPNIGVVYPNWSHGYRTTPN